MLLVITGTPGTGKSAVAAALAKRLRAHLVSITELVNEKRLYSIRNREKEVDPKKLGKALKYLLSSVKGDIVVEGHLASDIRLDADLVVVLRTHPNTLKKRLAPRKYSKAKLAENLLAEMLDYCTLTAGKNYKCRVLELDTTKKTIKESVDRIVKAIKNNKKTIDEVDYTHELVRHVKHIHL